VGVGVEDPDGEGDGEEQVGGREGHEAEVPVYVEVGVRGGGEEEAKLGAGVVEGFYADCKQRERCEQG
jgi:hypothetical protein